MKYIKIILVISFLTSFIEIKAETWNEPWQKEIIQKSDFFILGEILETDDKAIKVKVLKIFGNSKIEEEIIIDNFFLLTLSSSSGHGVYFNLESENKYYLFLKKNKNGNYSMPTPTSGYAYLDENKNVNASFRHSYHQAIVPQDIYELAYENIWDYYKKGKFKQQEINEFIDKQLEIEPASFSKEDKINIFYLQHAALETAYLLDLSIEHEKIRKFATSDNFHLRVSAFQLLGNSDTSESKELLLKSISNEDYNNFEKVIAIWAIRKIGDKSYISKLKEIQDKLSDEDTGFGGNIMDPRIGTHFPSPRGAVQEL